MNNHSKKEICKNLGSSSDRVSLSHIIFVKKNGERYRKFFFPKCCSRHIFQLAFRLFNGPTDPYFMPILQYFADFLSRYIESEQNDDWSDEEPTYIHEGESSDEKDMEKPKDNTNKRTDERTKSKTGKMTEGGSVNKVKDMISKAGKEVPKKDDSKVTTAELNMIPNAQQDLYEDYILYDLYECQAQISEDELEEITEEFLRQNEVD
ncbi:uncharacterized protein LOC119557649 [Drosophila subpulchrella]|uniref:uncharacterized protein LOC119557649 n=1 Tax=Drosophila subpulchrella TaxID=1486046 RepID=UPI0018A15915|nr:uncharacterized protein LOC119557649 [Drosophila subpulchrella]XP_037726429.1 uncharacterized protein LOC119557649 [Drosophila subpulchrella]